MIFIVLIVIWLDINFVFVNCCFLDFESFSVYSFLLEEVVLVFMNGGGFDFEINGYILVWKCYIELSLDELVMEIEVYEVNDEKLKYVSYENGVDIVE